MPLLDDITLVADELVTQSLLVGATPDTMLTFELLVDRYQVTLAVEDATDALRPRSATGRDGEQLNLKIISELADRWGTERNGTVTRTWASFGIPAPNDGKLLTRGA